MNYRRFGRTGWQVSEIGLGAWAIGADWGKVSDQDALDAIRSSLDKGVNLIDTADVYGDGRSEKLIAQIIKERSDRVYVLTKAGRRLDPHIAEGYNRKNLTAFVERSLRNLDTEVIDLVQLHCPPTQVYYMPEVFGILGDLIQSGKLRYYGVSVEKIEEGLKAIEYPNVMSVQIIFNLFRQRPAELFFDLAKQKNIAVIVRVPLASGLLTGKMTSQTKFSEEDHRNFNRYGQSFDVGETFAGVDFQSGLEAVDLLRPFVPEDMTMAQFALRWILMFPEVSTVIPGAKNRVQALDNARASDFLPFDEELMVETRHVYDQLIRDQVHHRW